MRYVHLATFTLAVIAATTVYADVPEDPSRKTAVDEHLPNVTVQSSYYLGYTFWGDWGILHRCPSMNGFRLKVEDYQGSLGDDSALNAVQFRCTSGEVFTSAEGHQGKWREWNNCPSGAYLKRLGLLSEWDQGNMKDDTAGNNLAAHCSDGTLLYGQGLWFGHWDWYECYGDSKVCGFKTRVEGRTGVHFDHTGLNQILMECC